MNRLVFKLKEIKNEAISTFKIIKISIKYGLQVETAYTASTIIKIVSTLAWLLTLYAFIDILYSNVDLVAGYSKDDMLLLLY